MVLRDNLSTTVVQLNISVNQSEYKPEVDIMVLDFMLQVFNFDNLS